LRRLAGKIPTTPINANTPGAGTVVAKGLVNFGVYVPVVIRKCLSGWAYNALNDLHKK